jgi:hypothetical protein
MNKVCLWQLHIPDEKLDENVLTSAFGEEGKFWGYQPAPEDPDVHIWALTPNDSPATKEQAPILKDHYYNHEWWGDQEDCRLVEEKYQ